MENLPVFTIGFVIVMDSIVAFTAWLIVARTLETMPNITHRTRRLWQGALALVLIGWFIVVCVLSALEFISVIFANGAGIFIAAAAPVIAGILTYRLSATVRDIVDRIPHWQLLAIQVFRNMGFAFLILLDLNLIPAEFALPAGLGDILVGMLAPIVTYMYLSKRQGATGLVILLHIMGLIDFASAFGTAALTANAGGFSALIVPYMMLIPGFVVPIFAMMHLMSIRKLIAEARPLSHNQVLASAS
jgi:hypothetical protein